MRLVDFLPVVRAVGIGVIVMFFMAAMTAFQRRKAKLHGGWRYLTPGPLLWIGLAIGVLLTAIFTLVSFAGSERAAGVFWVAMLFNLVTMALAYTIIVEEVRWNDTRIERRTLLFERRSITWHELTDVGFEPSGYWWVSGYDRKRIRFLDNYHGFYELVAKIAENLPPEGPPPQVAEAMETALARVRA